MGQRAATLINIGIEDKLIFEYSFIYRRILVQYHYWLVDP